ncbi:uncharacterized protein BXIN_0217 [Babesia sp. Xinjiang]|uniref:uncharacterized protein n=1 Tax=Babesia sp. Xinjiang TaxID=462227 RepID=UPI000A2401E5|nr:uncharacterized protein BXIN_0217 [Babesia sp. Xinjiang]ORM39848.1 hypothetical protein BXIN_0217 [Babesia sp. Xinjiang]
MASGGWSSELPLPAPMDAACAASSQPQDLSSDLGTHRTMVNLSGRPPRTEAPSSVIERYSGALEMLRNQLRSSTVTGNVTFEEEDINQLENAGHLSTRQRDPSHLIPIERDLCARSSLFLQQLLLRANTVSTSVLDGVLSDDEVIKRLRHLNDNFEFGKRLYLPEDDMAPEILNVVRTASAVFNGSCVTTVMWPCTDVLVTNEDRVRIAESTIFEALQIYYLRKHNRQIYVEWDGTASGSKTDAGPLPVDVTDAVVVREISDTILDELLATLWCVGYLALHIHTVGSDKLRSYAASIIGDPEELTSKLWEYYVSFTEHLTARFARIKAVDDTLKDRLSGRLIVEAHGVLVLQCAIVKAILDIHIGTRAMNVEQYQSYASYFGSTNFQGVFTTACDLIGKDECSQSKLLIHALHELQALGSLLLSSFYIYRCFVTDKSPANRDSFITETTNWMKSQLKEMVASDNKARAICIFSYTCFLQRLSQSDIVCNIDNEFVDEVSKHLDKYVSGLEWVTLSRDILGGIGYSQVSSDNVTTFPCRMLLIESLSQVIATFGIERLPGLDTAVNAVCYLVGRDEHLGRGHHVTKVSLLDRISKYLISQFPFGLNTLFQLLGAFLPSCTGQHDDISIDSECATMEHIVRYLLTEFRTIVVSPITAPLEYKSDTGEIELTEDVYIGVQLLHMLGLDKRMLLENWLNWEMGSCLFVLPAGTTGKQVIVNDLKNLSLNATAPSNRDQEDLWVVDAGISTLSPNHSLGALWLQEASLKKNGDMDCGIRGCSFDLENTVPVEISAGHKGELDRGNTKFTLIRALWLIWRGTILAIANSDRDLSDHLLRTFVTANSMLTGLISKYPRVMSLIEDHVSSTLHMREPESQYPFGPSSIIFHYALLFLVCLKKPQLHVMLPEVIDALRGFLIPTYVVPVGDNATEIEFNRYWIFLQSLEFCSQYISDEGGLSIFNLLERVMQEQERPLGTYPVTRGVLKFFKELLVQYPPELWMLSGWHHGMLNMSHTSLDMESSSITHGLGLGYLSTLKRYVDTHSYKAAELYDPFQSKLLCELFSYTLKSVSNGLVESDFKDNGERFDIMGDIAEITYLTCRIFRVYNYDNSKPFYSEAYNEDSWVQALNELINHLLLTLSASNYIMETLRTLTYQLDLLHYHETQSGGSLVMVNALVYSESSLTFFTNRVLLRRYIGLDMQSDNLPLGTYALRCQSSYKYRWFNHQQRVSPLGQSRSILGKSLKLLRQLYITALPPNRNPLFTTLAETLGSTFFMKCRTEIDLRGRFLTGSQYLATCKDPVAYFAMQQVTMMSIKLPQSSVIQSMVFHTYTISTISSATDIISLYLLLCEQRKIRTGEYLDTWIANNMVMLQQLGNIRNYYDVISQTNKDESCFYEHLITMFLDPRTRNYESRISILQFLLVALSTCSGMEMLWRNNGVDITALLEFIDSVLRYHLLHGRSHNLGDVTLAQYSMLIFSRLIELSKGQHKYCWNTLLQSVRVLVDLWRSFDSNLFVDPDVNFNQQNVVPRTTMVKELWFDKIEVDLYVDMNDSILERRIGLLRIMGSIYAILDSLKLQLGYLQQERTPSDDFLKLLSFVTMNWDFMDTLFPIVVYDSGFVDTYVKNDVTENNMRQYYRLGLWLGEDCLTPLSRCLHYLSDMKVPYYHLLMQGTSNGIIEPLDISAILSRFKTKKFDVKDMSKESITSIFHSLLSDIIQPPEYNGLDSLNLEKGVIGRTTEPGLHNYSFYTFGTSYEFGHGYLMDVEKFHHFCIVLLTSSDEKLNVLLCHEIASVRNCIELVPYIESLNELKSMILGKLSNLVTVFRSVGFDLTLRMKKLVKEDRGMCDITSRRALSCTMDPFQMFAFNGTMLLQLILTRPDCLSEHSLYVGLLIDLLRLIFKDGIDLSKLEHSFINYYECCGSSDNDDSGIVDYIVSRDMVGATDPTVAPRVRQSSDHDIVGQEFRLFAVNVFGGLVAQIARCILEFSDHFPAILNVNFTLPVEQRRPLKVRLAALESCQYYHGRGHSDDEDSSDIYSGDMGGNRECVCTYAVGKGIELSILSVWLHFKMCSFFSRLYKILSYAAKKSHELGPRGVQDGILDDYQRVTKYSLKSLATSCHKNITAICFENDRLLQSFVDRGILQNGEYESAFVYILGPYACILALESIIYTDFNSGFLQGSGYTHIVNLAESLTMLPYTTSACISDYLIRLGNFVNPILLMKRDKEYVVDCLGKEPFCYENRNWLRAVLFKLFERVNGMLVRAASSKSLLEGFADSQLIERIYLYSFLSIFVQPLSHVNPKVILSSYTGHNMDHINGNCVEVIHNTVTLWYPSYQYYRNGAPVRCPYHLLHCGLLRFVVDMCNSYTTEVVMDTPNFHGSVVPLVMELLHMLRERTRHLLDSEKLTMAILEECHVIFGLLRHVPSWHRLSDSDIALVPYLIKHAKRFFSTLMQAFQSGLEKIYDHIPGCSIVESPELLQKEPRVKAAAWELKRRERKYGSYNQRCLYLALKIIESYVTFLLNTDITLGCDCDLPPIMDHFVKNSNVNRRKRLSGVDRITFQSVLQGSITARIRCIVDQPSVSPDEPSFELMTDVFETCVDIFVWSLRLCKELHSDKDPFIYAVRRQAELRLPLSLYINARGDSVQERVDGVSYIVYNDRVVTPHRHVDVAPMDVSLGEFQVLFGCLIEKSVLFCSRVVNTAFLQNQLYPYEDRRLAVDCKVSRESRDHVDVKGTPSFHSTLTLLQNAFSEVDANSAYLSGSTSKFCSVLSGHISRRIAQSKVLSEAFEDSVPDSIVFNEESAIRRLLGDFVEPVPLVQVVGLGTREWQQQFEYFLDRNKVPYGSLDCAAFAECRSSNPSALMHYVWSRFVLQLVNRVCASFPREAFMNGKLKNNEVRNCLDFVRLLHSLTTTDDIPQPENSVRCIILLIQDYQELVTYEPALLNTLLRIHEKIARVQDTDRNNIRKIVVIFMGPYPVPPEAVKNDFTIPMLQLDVLDQGTRTERIIEDNSDYAVKLASIVVPQLGDEVVTFLWDGYVHYIIGVMYPWYKTDSTSMEFYCRLLWNIFLDPLRGCERPNGEQLEECLHHLCKSVDIHVRNVISHHQSRFICDLYDSSVSGSVLAGKRLHKFHGSQLAKYLLLGAAISTMSNPDMIRRRILHKKSRDINIDSNFWCRRRRFDFWTWIANTEWLLSSNENDRVTLNHVFFAQMMWIINEGYVKTLSNIALWRRLPSSRGARLWRVSDVLPSGDLPWRDALLHHSNTEMGDCLGQMLGTTSRFVLCAPKDMILSVVKDLNIDMAQYFF